MAGHSNKPHLPVKPKPPPATTATVSFAGCFGCSGRNSVAIIKVAAADPPPTHRNPIWEKKDNEKQKPRFPNWPSMRKPTPAAVPVLDSSSPAADDSSTLKVDAPRKSTDFHKTKFIRWKTHCKASQKSHPTAAAAVENKVSSSSSVAADEFAPSPILVQSPITGSPEKDGIVVTENAAVSGNRGDVEPSKPGTCKKRVSFCRKRVESGDRTKTGSSSSQPGSPVSRPNPQAQNMISRSTTFPAPDLHQVVEPILITNNKKIAPVKEAAAVEGRLDSVVGLSIIAVTLVIMVVWGRFCAIVCTAAWLYFVPRLRTTLSSEVGVKDGDGGRRSSGSIIGRDDRGLGGSGRVDLDSVEYKRRVVLEGLLERNRRPFA